MPGRNVSEHTGSLVTDQNLRRRIYIKAKAEKTWRFWGIYTHICKKETLQEAYKQVKINGGAPGKDGITFEEIESKGLDALKKGCNSRAWV